MAYGILDGRRATALIWVTELAVRLPEDHNNSKTVENWLGRLSAIGHSVKDADPLGQRHQFRQGMDVHLLHHPVS